MKEKIKKFVKKHEDFLSTAAPVAVVGAVGIAITAIQRNTYNKGAKAGRAEMNSHLTEYLSTNKDN